MEVKNIKFGPVDIFAHPHAEIVHECINAYLEKISAISERACVAVDYPEGLENDNCPRVRKSLRIHQDGNFSNPLTVKFEKRGNLSYKKRLPRNYFSNAYTSTLRALPFFKNYGYDYYYYVEEENDTLRAFDFLPSLIDLLKELEPYCMFNSTPHLPDLNSKKKGSLCLTIVLHDELQAMGDYDFSVTIRINSVKENIRFLEAQLLRKQMYSIKEGEIQ